MRGKVSLREREEEFPLLKVSMKPCGLMLFILIIGILIPMTTFLKAGLPWTAVSFSI